MFNRTRIAGMVTAVCCAATLCLPALAAEVDCDSVYCFTGADFQEEVVGICVTDLPDPATGTVLLGTRVVRPGDILAADQLDSMTFSPLWTGEDQDATVSYLPIFENRVAEEATMTIAIHGKQDKAPVAEDSALETYKNLENTGRLKVTDPEGQKLTFTVTRQPKRGSLDLKEDGTYLYTPKKNKVGVDSFTYTATDPAGKVSREATVTIQILKPTDDARYSDTAQFEAEWLRNTGLFQGEKLGNQLCFQPEKTVSRGEFIAMVMKLLDVPTAEIDNENIPQWLLPYYAAAMRSGFMTNFPTDDLDAPITPQEAATLLQNALELPGEAAEAETFAQEALAVMNRHDLLLGDGETLTRADVATLLYQISHLSPL